MRRSRFTFALVMALGLSVVAAMSGAAVIADDTVGNFDRFPTIDTSLFQTDGQSRAFVPASLSDELVSVVMEMSGDPVSVQDAATQRTQGRKLTGAEKQAIRGDLQARQDGLHGDLDRVGAQVVGQMQDAYNGIQVVVPEKNLDQLAALPGVVALHAVATFTPDNTNGVPFIGGPQAWGSFNATGIGVKVASIDTGIDYTHADFGGPGTVDAFKKAKASSTLPADPALFGPAAPKVKGGFDFAGDAFNASDPNHNVPVPDPNPLDCNGHGSHTAGTMAGFGVLSTGATFTGPYNATTESNTFNVGPGVAPQADIYAYRVFGCTGSSNVVDLAINRAVADDVDVISMSLGSPFGGTTDPTTVAAQHAFDDGITVVASAGNNGTNAYLVGSPSTANGVLSVAAIDGSVPTFPGASLGLSSGATVKTIDANGAPIPAATFPVKVLKNSDGSVSEGCNPTEYAGTAGMVVVTVRNGCARVARAIFGQQHGAAAVVMINSAAGFPPFEGPITSNPDTGQPFTVTIPFLGALASDTKTLVAADGGTATLSSTTVPNSNFQKAASFTSGGPRSPDSAPKPDVIAPGVSVASVGMGTGTKAAVMSGTSMACPMTAGTAALVKQIHPTWRGAQIKAAIMNTANPSLNIGYNTRVAGTGVVQAQNAVNSSVVASTSDGLDSIAFGYVQGSSDYNASKSFTLTNYGTTAATYDLSVAGNGLSQLGATVSVSPGTVTVPAGATKAVQVSLSILSTAFAALPTDDILATGLGVVTNVRGNVVATPAAGDAASAQTLRVPYLVVPRGLSAVVPGKAGPFSNVSSVSSTGAVTPGHTIAANLPLSNSGIHTGTADLYAWAIHEAQTTGSGIDVRDVGLQVHELPNNDRGLVFLINTYGQTTNQSKNEFDVVISVNGDTSPDFVVVGADFGAVTTGSFDGRFASFTFDAHSGKLIGAVRVSDAPMNGAVIELPTLASSLGLSPRANGVGDVKREGITFHVNAFDLRTRAVDRTGSATLNPLSPSVSSGNFATLAPGGSTSFTLAVDTDQQFAQPALGWLVASLDNASGPAQVSEVSAPSH